MTTDRPHIAVFLATSGHSGVDRVMGNLIPEMARQGAKVDLLKVDRHGPYLRDVPAGVRIIELGSRHANTSLLPLIRYLRRERPEALLSDKDRVNRTAIWARSIARVPVRHVVRLGTTVSLNLKGKNRLERWAQRFSIRHFYRRAHHIIAPSQGVADDLVAAFDVPLDRIKVLKSPVLTPEMEALAKAQPALPWTDQSPFVLGVGHLCPRKDFATLVRAVARVREQRPCRLVILGDGRERNDLLELARAHRLGDDLYMPGFSANPYSYMRKAGVLVLTSRWEGLPVVIAEGLALGTPVVATDCPSGPREILGDGAFGILAPMGDADAVASGILESLAHPPASATLRGAVQGYEVTTSTREYLRVLLDTH
ncbi:glycosyltransferase [Aquisalimonas sp.]|uniref:glycosyltransferase n=1 Tax=Aquisalimonas sp. TaxID=1872621 RepID=UPI0025B92135|nr:glycosyltransferase [Aquisalimonas sp.]